MVFNLLIKQLDVDFYIQNFGRAIKRLSTGFDKRTVNC